jgi:hypothetical protein
MNKPAIFIVARPDRLFACHCGDAAVKDHPLPCAAATGVHRGEKGRDV